MFVAGGVCSEHLHDVMAGLIKNFLASRDQKEPEQACLCCGEAVVNALLLCSFLMCIMNCAAPIVGSSYQ
jgi:hypothetical protein